MDSQYVCTSVYECVFKYYHTSEIKMADATLADVNTGMETGMEEPKVVAEPETKDKDKGRRSRSKSKRKTDSPHKTQSLKRHNSLPDESDKTQKIPQSQFSEMMKQAFKDEEVFESFAPMLLRCIHPVIDVAMEKAADRAVEKVKASILDPVLQSNKELKETVNKQSDLIKSQRKLIEEQQITLKKNCADVNKLKVKIEEIKSQLEGVKTHSNDIEQYGRRHSIRLMKFKCGEDDEEKDNVNRVVNFVNAKILTGEDKIVSTDIERCHPVGEHATIVKFKMYYTKQKVFAAKKNLKNNPDKIFMTEDLTKFNHSIVSTLIPLRKTNKLASFWTRNGTVFAKKLAEDVPVKVRSPEEAKELFA